MRKNFDIPALRARLAGQTGPKYWRSLEELAATPEFEDLLKHEFPQGADIIIFRMFFGDWRIPF